MEISPMSRKRPFDTSTASAARAVPALVAPLGQAGEAGQRERHDILRPISRKG
jgi:hypothetical protein